MADNENKLSSETKRAYAWPWWVLGAVLLAMVLAVLWMRQEIVRTRMIRDLSAPTPQTNHVSRRIPKAGLRRSRRRLKLALGAAR